MERKPRRDARGSPGSAQKYCIPEMISQRRWCLSLHFYGPTPRLQIRDSDFTAPEKGGFERFKHVA